MDISDVDTKSMPCHDTSKYDILTYKEWASCK